MPDIPVPAMAGMVFLLVWDIAIENSGNVRFYELWPRLGRARDPASMIYLFRLAPPPAQQRLSISNSKIANEIEAENPCRYCFASHRL